ncbi:MAG TPA: hypothetical protein VF505_14935 [Thermoanaerobaculia bacterium]
MITVFLFSIAMATGSGDQAACPMHEQHMKAAQADGSAGHGTEVDARHDTFGMSHESSHHNFRQFKDGGAIELRANDPNNTAMIDMIRKHLREINASFVKSDFSTPGFVHGHIPDGVAEMKRLSDRIRYQYEDVDNGGRIRMTSSDAKALVAIHDFMKFQVIEHRTSDPDAIEEDK